MFIVVGVLGFGLLGFGIGIGDVFLVENVFIIFDNVDSVIFVIGSLWVDLGVL